MKGFNSYNHQSTLEISRNKRRHKTKNSELNKMRHSRTMSTISNINKLLTQIAAINFASASWLLGWPIANSNFTVTCDGLSSSQALKALPNADRIGQQLKVKILERWHGFGQKNLSLAAMRLQSLPVASMAMMAYLSIFTFKLLFSRKP